jgi:hypothetical protein
MLKDDITSIPDDEGRFVEEIMPTIDSYKINLTEYGL